MVNADWIEALIIDEVEQIDADGVVISRNDEQIGGSGIYAMIGARMFLEPGRLGMIVNYTTETLPEWMRSRLNSYGPDMWHFKHRRDGHGTCRSVQTYQDGARRETLIDYLLFNPLDLLDSPFHDPLPSTIHAVSFIERTWQIVREIRQIASDRQPDWSPTIIWEPYYAESVSSNWQIFMDLVPQVAVFSPNHVEALKLCDISIPSEDQQLSLAVEQACLKLAKMKPQLATIVRAGALGVCFVRSDEPEHTHWIPAYWTSEDREKIVDPTGAGNGFMGGFAAALDDGLDVRHAVMCGTVSASFMIEQAGLPDLSGDQWNGEYVSDRLNTLRKRMEGRGDFA